MSASITLTHTVKTTEKGTVSLQFTATGYDIDSAVFAIEVLPSSYGGLEPNYRFSHVCSPAELEEFPRDVPGDSSYFRVDSVEMVFDTVDMVQHVVDNMRHDVARLVREELDLENAEGVTETVTFDETNV